MKIYIAAPFELRREAIAAMKRLEADGAEVTSTWLREDDALDNASAELDLHDVARADALLAINPEAYRRSGTGGRHVELGYALALGKDVALVGQRTNIFHYLDRVHVFESLDAAERFWKG